MGLLLAALPVRAAAGPGAAPFSTMMRAWASGDLHAAISAASDVLKVEPANAAYLNAIGSLYCDKAKNANLFTKMSWAGKCRGAWEQASTIVPTDTDVRFNLIQYYAQAPGIAGGNMDKAKTQAKAVAALDGVLGEIAWGHVARAEKQLGEAERRYRKAAEIDTAGMRGPVSLANFLVSQKRWPEARRQFEERLTEDPGDRFAAYQLARVLQAEGVDLLKALQLFERVLSGAATPGGPTHADAWFRKGQVLDRLGRKTDAIAAMEAALKLVPDHFNALRELKRLRT
jgi:tetratricopeptide (TPR) repeat protein